MKLINQLFRKESQPDAVGWLLLALWAGGSFLLAYGSSARGYYSRGDEVNLLILWFTAYAVARYTKASHDLLSSTSRQIEVAQEQVHEMKETQMNEFLPILVPAGGGVLQGGSVDLEIRNVGKGIAKNISIQLGSVDIMDGFDLSQGGDSMPVKVSKHEENVRITTETEKPEEVFMEISYCDIYNRRHRTSGLVFRRDASDRGNLYVLQQGRWNFHMDW